VQITFEGRNLDVFVGASAPFVAWLLSRGRLSPRALVAWNVGGIAVLAHTIFTVVTSTPGPLHRAWPGEPYDAIATWPVIAARVPRAHRHRPPFACPAPHPRARATRRFGITIGVGINEKPQAQRGRILRVDLR
jgi:hypothetical protein